MKVSWGPKGPKGPVNQPPTGVSWGPPGSGAANADVPASRVSAIASHLAKDGARPAILIANRGEIAIRIADAAASLNLKSIAVFSEDDAQCLHVRKADEAFPLKGTGAAAYLDVEQIANAARETGAAAVHPGYGFLAESPALPLALAKRGIAFIGPTAPVLELFGDKQSAKDLAAKTGVATVPGTNGAIRSPDEAVAFMKSLVGQGVYEGVMVKAVYGGGGRGMRAVTSVDALPDAVARCQSEARASFGRDEVYCEALVSNPRHVEVQLLATAAAQITLGTRDCTLQRRHQKIIEIAPAPMLDPRVAKELEEATVKMAKASGFVGLGTWEFLVKGNRWWFMEVNARVQVEHTVTEEVFGVDLVASQIRIGLNPKISVEELGLVDYANGSVRPRGWAVQLRVNMEKAEFLSPTESIWVPTSGGTLLAFEPPSGRGIRVDTSGYSGYRTNANFDPLLAKIIVSSPSGSLAAVFARCRRALEETRIEGVETNAAFLKAILENGDVEAFGAGQPRGLVLHTKWIEDKMDELCVIVGWKEPEGRPQGALSRAASRPLYFTSADLGSAVVGTAGTSADAAVPSIPAPPGTTAVPVPMQATIVSIDVSVGQTVKKGQQIGVLNAMKMEHVISAPFPGVVRMISAAVGQTLPKSFPFAFVEPAGAGAGEGDEEATKTQDPDRIRPDLALSIERHEITLDHRRPDAVARRRKLGHRTARENVEDLIDKGSFIEYGPLMVAAQRQRRSFEDLLKQTPADGLVAGWAHVNGDLFDDELRTRVMVASYDYTVLAGTQGALNHRKKDRLFSLALERRVPVVFFCEGGGGRPGDTDIWGASGGLDIMTFRMWGQLSGLVPMIGITNGYCFAGNAALLGCCDVIIATENSNIGMGGPAMIEGGGLGVVKPTEVGPVSVQAPNGVIDILVKDEAEAVRMAKKYLSYFQGPLKTWTCPDQRNLRHIVPENRLRAYDIRKVIYGMADTDSVLELREQFGLGMITALIRIEGRPMGLIANNTWHLGGAIDADAGDKASRFMQLCDAYELPIVALCDTPGFMVGVDHEKTALVRHVSRMMVTAGSITVPYIVVVPRKGYGLGAQAMAAGSFHGPHMIVSWPTGEFGGMGLEGAVRLAYRNELAAIPDPKERLDQENRMIAELYENGKAIRAAEFLEIDDVIDPADTRRYIIGALKTCTGGRGWVPGSPKKRPMVDTW
ncbi:carbamoyl-phosphate synthase L chain ATP-binding protein [Hyaloraphidium curvatum]|nr:carbamoyl-phosphate synthase L chain ATP-binding protein [Hyaloraphidium curvatum]